MQAIKTEGSTHHAIAEAIAEVVGRGLSLFGGSLTMLDHLLASGGLDNARSAVRASRDRRALHNALGSAFSDAAEMARGA